MSAYPVSVTFHDVAACFSAEEWGELKDWQKDLYKKVMLEIHSALEAMGFEILNRDVLFCIKKVKDLYIDICETERAISNEASAPRDPGRIIGMKQEQGLRLDCCRKKSAKSTTHHVCNPDLRLRIMQDDQVRQSPVHSSADPIVTSVFSLQKDKEEPSPVDSTEGRTVPVSRRLTSQTIKQEKAEYVKVSVGGHGSEGAALSPAVWSSSQLMHYEEPDYMKVSVRGPGPHCTEATGKGQVTTKPIKQEEPEYIKVSVGGQGPVSTTGASREPIEYIHREAAISFSPQGQDAAEDSSKDSSEEPSILSPDRRPHQLDIIEERETAPESDPERHNHQHQFSAISSTLHNLTSHQRESNLLMQEQNTILSQIAYSLNLLQIQQTDGLAALGSIIQKGIEVIRPPSCMSPNDRTTEHPNIHAGLRRQVKNINNTDQPVPPKRKIT
ncbi:uncharacterized protein LOC130361122 isoform X3 [Hyla sarda]|uniref:uncharacterized protein LOC130361122 isoform X3 n=1 Tax=Hyla sarda TaxID=327740 RepID=UPI0024C226BB|nr:uncharacterized protein LOC130361122 isoform X3 [Hyla sarda]